MGNQYFELYPEPKGEAGGTAAQRPTAGVVVTERIYFANFHVDFQYAPNLKEVSYKNSFGQL